MTLVKTRLNLPFDDRYANAVGALPGANEPWIDDLRQTARAILETDGMPTRKTEAWKYTRLNDVANTSFEPASNAEDVDVPTVPITAPVLEGALKLVFVNGAFRADLSDPIEEGCQEGLVIQRLSKTFSQSPDDLKSVFGAVASPGSSFIAALNTGFVSDGLYVAVEEGVEVTTPLHIISIGASGGVPSVFHPRFVVNMSPRSSATIVECHIGLPGQTYLSNPVSEILVNETASLQHYVLVTEDSDASHLGRTAVHVGRSGAYSSFTLSMGGTLVRREVNVALDEDNAEARVDGVYGIVDEQHSDIYSEIIHSAPHTASNQVVKGVLGGKSRGVFQGRIHVAREAQKTDGRQLHKALLLNRGPEVDCKPELEIFADDVQCAHGATTGELDKEHIFYLLSRGIDENTARALLVEGFLDEVVLDISHEATQHLILSTVKTWLARHSSLIGVE